MVYYSQKRDALREEETGMASYCGKDCEACTEREKMGCGGCKAWSAGAWPGACGIAQCCRGKGHDSCGTCTLASSCAKLRGKGQEPWYSLRQLESDANAKRQLQERGKFLGKWLWLLFWLFVPGIVAGLMTEDMVAQNFPALYRAGNVLNFLCVLAYSLLLWKLARENDRYKAAGVCELIAAVLGLAVFCLEPVDSSGVAMLLVGLLGLVLDLVGQYQEFTAHSEVLQPVDAVLSEKWRKLWKWTIGMTVGLYLSMILALTLSVVGILILLVVAIGAFVVGILKLYYLYHTAQTFRMLGEVDPPAAP